MPLEHPERDELRAGQHLLERVRHGVEHQRVEGAVRPERGNDHRAALVDPDRDPELLGRVPHGVVGAVRQRPAAAGVGPDEPGDEAQLGHRPSQLAGRRVGVLQGQHRRPEEPPGVGGAVAGQPVVVGGRQRHRGAGVLDGREVQAEGRVQHGLVDALGVHVAQARPRVPPAGQGVGQRAEGGGVVEGGAGPSEVPERDGQDLGVAHHDVLVARRVGADPGPVGIRQARPGHLGLDHVPVGVDHGPGARRERVRPALCRGRHGRGVRQSSAGGSGWRNRRLALPPATARSSSSGSAPQASVSTRWVSGHEESAWG